MDADDIAAAILFTMDDDELLAHLAEVGARLDKIPVGEPQRGKLLDEWRRACQEANKRGGNIYLEANESNVLRPVWRAK